MKTKQLTKEEIAQLKGGWRDYPPLGYEVKNINRVSSCTCEFNNSSATLNKNTVDYCTCVCI